MQTPKKNHYVPQVYLRQFLNASSSKLFTLKAKSPYPKQIRQYSTSAVCYSKNFYTYSEKFTRGPDEIIDRYEVEKIAFGYENKQLPDLWNKIVRRRPFSLQDRFALSSIILDIKRRNPSFASRYIEEGLAGKSVEKVITRFKNSFKPMWNDTSPDGNTYGELMENVEALTRTYMSDSTNLVDMYREGFMRQLRDADRDLDFAREFAISKIFIYVNLTSTTFITSDNPGYTVTKKGVVENVSLKDWMFYVFPLDPHHTCVISLYGEDPNRSNQQANLIYELATPSIVDSINLATLSNCNKMIISSQLQILEEYRIRYFK